MIHIFKLEEGIAKTYIITLRDSTTNLQGLKSYINESYSDFYDIKLNYIFHKLDSLEWLFTFEKDISRHDFENILDKKLKTYISKKKTKDVEIIKLHKLLPGVFNPIFEIENTWINDFLKVDFKSYSTINSNFTYMDVNEGLHSCIMGIDTGKTGAIVLINKDNKIVYKSNIPKFEKDIGLNYDEEAIFLTISMLAPYTKKIVVEQIHSIFQTSKNTAFLMGVGFGLFKGLLSPYFGRVKYIPPKSWQKKVWSVEDYSYDKFGKLDTKTTSLNSANRIFKNENFLTKSSQRKPQDGVVDAALIAVSEINNL